MAAKARAEFRCFKVTEENSKQWKEESLRKGIYKMENPQENLVRHHKISAMVVRHQDRIHPGLFFWDA